MVIGLRYSEKLNYSDKRYRYFADGFIGADRIAALQKLGFSGVERPADIVDILRGRGITGERLSQYTSDNAFDLGASNVQALAAEHRKSTTKNNGHSQLESNAGAFKDSSPKLNDTHVDLSIDEDSFAISESENQVL